MPIGMCRSTLAALAAALVLVSAALAVSLFQLRSMYITAKLIRAEPVHIGYFDNKAEVQRAAVSGKPLVVFFGDSRIAGWQPLPQIDRFQMAGRGIGGETTAQMKFRFADDVLGLSPKVLVIQAGINDLMAAALEPAQSNEIRKRMLGNLDAMLADAEAAGIRTILLPVILPNRPRLTRLLVWPAQLPALVAGSNLELAEVAARHGANFPDANMLFLASDGTPDPAMYLDELHFSPLAYGKLNALMTQALNQMIPD